MDDRQQAEICSIAREIFGAHARVNRISVDRLERRTLRYTIDLASGGRWKVVGKVYGNEDEGARGFDVLRRLGQTGFAEQPPVAVQIPAAYRYLPHLRLLLMEHAPGAPLRTLVKQKLAGAREMAWLAAALAKLHSRRPEEGDEGTKGTNTLGLGPPFTVDRHLAIRCAGLHEALAEAFPGQGDSVRSIVETARILEIRNTAAPTLSHGDFHLGQLHVHERGVWILDLDPLHVGDPSYDIAMVFVMLKRLEHRTGDPAYVRRLLDAFIDAYFSNGTCERATRVPMHMGLIQLKRACKRFRWQDEPGWQDIVVRQIADAVLCMRVAVQLPGAPLPVEEIGRIYTRCPASI